MRVSVRQENLARGLGIVGRAVESRPTLPVLANILLRSGEEGDARLRLSAMNMSSGLSISCWIGAQVGETGAITLPRNTLTDLVNNLSPERVDLNLEDSTRSVTVRCGANVSTLRGIDAGEFVTPHNLYVDGDDLVYVCDRDNHRIQIFDARGNFVTMWNNIHRPTCICIDSEDHVIIGELNGFENVEDCPGLGHRVGVYDKAGSLLTRFGRPEEGEGPDQFIAPHGIDVDSRGDLYVCDVGYTIRGRYMDPPREVKTLRKFARVRQ